MFPKIIGNNRTTMGVVGGTIALLEDSAGECYLSDNVSVTNADVDNVAKYELDEGGGYVERSISYIQDTPYGATLLIRKRFYNPYFDAYTSYISGTATATDTGGQSTKSAQLASLGTITLGAFSGPSAGTTDIQITVPAGMIGYTVYAVVSGTMTDYGAPFASYPYNVSSDTVIAGTTVNIALTYNPPGGSGSYYGDYTTEIYLRYVYPDGPFAQGNVTSDSGTF